MGTTFFKRAALVLAALWCCAGLALNARAIMSDMDYEGELDSFTGLPPTAAEAVQSSLIRVSSVTDYDVDAGEFLVYQDRVEDIYIRSSVLPGMQVREAVRFSGDLASSCQLLRNGTLIEDANLSSIEEPGQYLLAMGDYKVPGTASMSFTILGEVTGLLESFAPPVGCFITEATLNDGAINFNADYVSMAVDGTYAVRYRCVSTGLIYSLEVVVDHTPPVLSLPGVVDGVSSGAVSIADLEEGATVSIVCGGIPLEFTDVLTQQGAYQLIVTDAAGNNTLYQFTIPIYFNRNSLVFFGLVVLSLGGLIAYLWRAKTHLRVR